jgi:UDP-N-acetylmuramoyl-L-alanyl-D-glutamate--2,6-diaminopimelate ligase
VLNDVVRPVRAAFPWAEPLLTVGVTGTNGKTSTSHFIAAILRASGRRVVCQSTLGYFLDGEELPIERSEQGFVLAMQRAVGSGAERAVVEVTSKALGQGYARRWRFDHGVFTNLTRDHVAEHGSWEHYLASKAQLFVHLGPGRVAVLNAHDEGALLLDRIVPPDVRRVWYGAPSRGPRLHDAELGAARVVPSFRGTSIELDPSPLAERLGGKLAIGLTGEVYAENALAAAAFASSQDVDAAAIHAGFAACHGLPGRFELVHEDPHVVLDFAHTPDALVRVCDTARALVGDGRLFVVFGAAGGFDGPKRPAMGEAVGARADVAIVTDENPRNEDPSAIIATLAAGCRRPKRASVRVIEDRAEAIKAAVREARPGDLVLITGRGREEGLTRGSVVTQYSDVDALQNALS